MIELLKDKLVRLILDGIDKDRKGESVNQSVLHGVINSLVDVADKRQKTLVVIVNLQQTLKLFSIFVNRSLIEIAL